MSPSDPGAWQRTSPFAIVFFIGKTIKSFTQSVIQLVATFGALVVLIERNPQVALVIPVGILAIIAAGVLQYWFFRFRIEEDRIHIHQGVVRKTALDIPFDRVQGINVERSLIDRILGLVTVSLDTAGSATAEGQLPSVTSELADDLRGRIRASRPAKAADDVSAGDVSEVSVDGVARETSAPAESLGQVLLKLRAGDIFRIGCANRNLFLAAAFLGIFGQSIAFAEERLSPILESFAGTGTLIQVLVVIGFVLVGLAIVLFGAAFLRYHGFTLWREGTAYRTRAGLLTQREVVVENRKIQQLTLSHKPGPAPLPQTPVRGAAGRPCAQPGGGPKRRECRSRRCSKSRCSRVRRRKICARGCSAARAARSACCPRPRPSSGSLRTTFGRSRYG